MSQTERFDDTHFLSLGGSTRAIKPGDIVGGAYMLKSLLGQGGMGYVFLAEHNIINKDYALKIIRPDKIDDFSRQRFEIEGRVIAKLDHPNIVKIYNMGVDHQCPFYVMDLLPGKPLSDYIKQGDGLTFEQCLDIFRQVAEGLAYAHKKDIVHRDVKPANIILLKEEDGFLAKLVDFGLAKVINPIAGQAITAKGQIFGSPLYMSPEQCLGQSVDHRSDIYSLGCALFESIAGEPPFAGANAMQTLMMHTESAMPKLAERFSEEPAIAVDSLIAKMTAKEPRDRYQSMDEVAAALGRLQKRALSFSFKVEQNGNDSGIGGEGESSLVQSASAFSRVYSKWLLASLFVVLSVVFAVAYFNRDKFADTQKVVALPSDAVSLLSFGPIKSRIVSVTGNREFRFPDTAIGTVTDLSDGNLQPAVGLVQFKKTSIVALSVDEQLVPLVFKYPQVFEQIGRDEFSGLSLRARDDMQTSRDGPGPPLDFNGLARSDILANSQKQLIAILKAVASWQQLCALTIDGFDANDQVFQMLERLPKMTVLSLKRVGFPMKKLVQQKFLNRLTHLTIQDPGDSKVDVLFYKLAESPNIASLELENVEFLAESLGQLKRCPKLRQLVLNKSDITDEAVRAISQLNNLEVFMSKGGKLTDSQIASLAKLKKLHVTLAAADYTGAGEMRKSETLKAYRTKFPNIAFE